MAQAESDRIKAEAIADREAAEMRARVAESRVRELEASHGNDTFRYQVASLERDCQRLQADLITEREALLRSENDSDARVEQLQKVGLYLPAALSAEHASRHIRPNLNSLMSSTRSNTIILPKRELITLISKRYISVYCNAT